MIATVGGSPVFYERVAAQTRASLDRQIEQYGQMGMADGIPPFLEANISASELKQALDQAAALTLAQRAGIRFTDEEILVLQSQLTENAIQEQRLQLSASGQLKPGASEKDFAEIYKKLNGRTPDDVRLVSTADLKKRLGDKAERAQIASLAAGPLLLNLEKSRLTATDDLVKASYNTFTVKRILIGAKAFPSADPKVLAAKILADLKGSLTFEQAMDKYSVDTPQPKKKISESSSVFTASQIDNQPELKPLLNLKVGDVSEAISLPEGLALYKLVNVKTDLPKDYEIQKAKYKDEFLTRQAGQVVSEQIKKLVNSSEVSWKSPGYQALMLYVKYEQDARTMDAATRMSQAQAVADAAKKAIDSTQGYDQRAAILARFAAIDAVYKTPGADTASLRDQRIDSLMGYLNGAESFSVRMDLVDLYTQKKDSENAFLNLIAAAQANISYDRTGQAHFADVAGKVTALKASGLLVGKQEESILKEQERWKKEKVAFDLEQADRTAQEAKDRKAAEEAQRIMEKEAKDKASEAKGASGLSPTPDGTRSTTPGSGLSTVPPTTPTATTGG